MAIDLGNAYVQIIPSAKGISGAITKELNGEAQNAGKTSGESLAGSIVGTLKKALVAAGVGKIIQSALTEGGKLQQSFGGLDTIYGEASQAAKDYANQAVLAGISANDYAEQAVAFGASLKQAFGGDTAQAAQAANTAILDMADNAAKMGTPLENIQNAYQGFAKQNYTMLDNLKLGYGGTKTEMERLLADAEKISGVKYDISSLGDVYDAIHVIQGELGLTGVAADEASGTFSGAMLAMQAAASNLLGQLTTGGDITAAMQTLVTTASTFIGGNLIPMVINIFKAIPAALQTAITEGLPMIFESIMTGLSAFGVNMNGGGVELITNLLSGITSSVPAVITQIGEMANGILTQIVTKLPEMLTSGIEIVQKISEGIGQAIPAIMGAATNVITNLLQTLLSHLPQIVTAGLQLLQAVVQGFWDNKEKMLYAVANLVIESGKTILNNLPQILQAGVELIGAMIAGIVTRVPHVITEIKTLITKVGQEFTSFDWASLGKRIIEGIVNGLKNAGSLIIDAAKNAAKSAFESAKDFLGINSPSRLFRDEVGAMMAEGMAVGFEDNVPVRQIEAALQPMSTVVPEAAAPAYDYGGFTINVYGAPGQDMNTLADIISSRINSQIQQGRAVFA